MGRRKTETIQDMNFLSKIRIHMGDITDLESAVDCIVNAANQELLRGGGGTLHFK